MYIYYYYGSLKTGSRFSNLMIALNYHFHSLLVATLLLSNHLYTIHSKHLTQQAYSISIVTFK